MPVRINAGGPAWTDPDGLRYAADFGFVGGTPYTGTGEVKGTAKDELYRSLRWGMTGYNIPVSEAGTYRVTLRMAEFTWNSVGKRVFSVTAEGTSFTSNLDVFARTGGRKRALAITKDVPVNDGSLTLRFTATVDNAMVSGISVEPVSTTSPTSTASSTPTSSPSPTTTPTPTTTTNPGGPADDNDKLFFAKSTASTSRKVFGHYFAPLPRSRDNLNPLALGGSGDYYDTQYLDASGESGQHAAYGGFLRDRPIPRAPISVDWNLEDMKWEIRTAQTLGLDGFYANIMSLGNTRYRRLVDAANALNTGFKVVPMLDAGADVGSYSVRNGTPAQIADDVAYYVGKPSTFLEGGKLVVSSFGCQAFGPTRWTEIFNAIKARTGLSVTFECILSDGLAQYRFDQLAPICDYFGAWFIGADPATLNATSGNPGADAPSRARAKGKKWVAPAHTQIVAPYTSHYFDEAANSGAVRASWLKNVRDNADRVQAITWNDFGEGGALGPSVAKGWSQAAIAAYYIQRYKVGSFPAITRDVAFVSHRDQPLQATYQSKQSELMHQVIRNPITPVRDKVEVLTYLTAPADISVTIGGATTTYTAPAGEYVKLFDNKLGRHSVRILRNGSTVGSVTSPFPVTSNPISQDRQYFFYSTLHSTAQQYYPLMRL